MKNSRIAIAMLAAAISIGLSGCGGTRVNMEARPITIDDIALLDKSGNIVLEYRMTREDTENYLGIPDEISGYFQERSVYGETTICYASPDDDEAAIIPQERAYNLVTIEEIVTKDARLSTPRGISVGENINKVLKEYGMPQEYNGTPYNEDNIQELLEDESTPLYYKFEGEEVVGGVLFNRFEGNVSSITVQAHYAGRRNEGHAEDAKESLIPMSELVLKDATGKRFAEIGMTKEEIDEVFGDPIAGDETHASYDSLVISIGYENGIATSLMTFDESMYTPSGIHVGSTRDEIITAYGTPDPGRGESIDYRRQTKDGKIYCLCFYITDGICDEISMSMYAF